MDCFDNLIGIHRTCSPVIPSSGLYIQDLPGITLSVANAAVDNETISGVKLIEEKISFAQNAILAQLRNQLADKIKINSIIQNDTIGFYRENLQVVSSESGKLKGIQIKTTQYPNLEFFISKIFLKLAQSVTTKIYIYDLMTNTKLDEFDITTVANVPTAVLVNKAYPTLKQRLDLFICIDAGISNTYETSLTPSVCYSCGNGYYSNNYLQATGGSIDDSAQKIDLNFTPINGTNGLSLDYSLNCSIEPFICNMGNQLAWPLLHKVGSELMKELLYSRRLNSIINIDSGTNKSLMESFENEYMASMGAILNNIKAPNDMCFQCNSRIKKAVAIP